MEQYQCTELLNLRRRGGKRLLRCTILCSKLIAGFLNLFRPVYKSSIRKAELRDGMEALRSLRTEYCEIIVETSSVGVWVERPPFDVRICQFEMEQ